MAVRTEFNTDSHLKRMNEKYNDYLILAADHLVAQLRTPGITPVITGNLVNSTYRGSPQNLNIKIGQNAEYAMSVEARRFHFSYAIQLALPGIRALLKHIKID